MGRTPREEAKKPAMGSRTVVNGLARVLETQALRRRSELKCPLPPPSTYQLPMTRSAPPSLIKLTISGIFSGG